MAELVHVAARIEATTQDRLKEMAKARMMATGEVCTVSDLIREALAAFVAVPAAPAAPEVPERTEEQIDLFGLQPATRKGNNKRDELLPEALRLRSDGMSQGQIAAALGVNQAQISRWFKVAVQD